MTGHEGNTIRDLMGMIGKNAAIPRPEVDRGGMIVNVEGQSVRVGPEILDSFREMAERKRQATANGEPYPTGWQTEDEEVKKMFRAIATATGFAGLFD